MTRALLIDDEPYARADLRERLGAHPEVTIVGEAATVRTARSLLTSADYDLVFLDVHLVGGESFQLLPDVRRGASVIFATAAAVHAGRAVTADVVACLLKPVEPHRLAEALRRVGAVQAAAASGARGVTLRPAPAPVVNGGYSSPKIAFT